MYLGPSVRKMFGPYERHISDAYRAIYLDISALVRLAQEWKPDPKRILEVGCGEGAVTSQLSVAYPNAKITAIDITPRIGRLYQGTSKNIRFARSSVEEIAEKEVGEYDLVMLNDVLHHVPVPLRSSLLNGIRATMAPGGTFIFKDWQKNLSPIHLLCYASDRWLTGDRVSYLSRVEMLELLVESFGNEAIAAEARIGPWWNNIATLVRLAA